MADDDKPAAPKRGPQPTASRSTTRSAAGKPRLRWRCPSLLWKRRYRWTKVRVRQQAESPIGRGGRSPRGGAQAFYADKAKWSGGPAFFTSVEMKDAAFCDQGRRLVTAIESEDGVKDLVSITQHRGWDKDPRYGNQSLSAIGLARGSAKGSGGPGLQAEPPGYAGARPAAQRCQQEHDRTDDRPLCRRGPAACAGARTQRPRLIASTNRRPD